jgi:hypothetical protein
MKCVKDPLEAIKDAKSVYVKQVVELFEMMTGYEIPNRYHVYAKDNDDNLTYLFKAKEESGYCVRNCTR